MWVFSTRGFVSVVQHNSMPDYFQVKARVPDPLEKLWPEHQIQVIEWADYRYRINVRKEDALPVIIRMVESVDYTNFKHECVEIPEYHRSLARIWNEMYNYQATMESD